MIFTVEDPGQFTDHYIKDDKGLIIGSVRPTADGWAYQSCLHNLSSSWSRPEHEQTKMEAVNAAIADYIARRME
jgi:hypothetical protein